MYLDEYKIEGTVNNDQNPCFNNAETYPKFQENLEKFKKLLVELVDKNESKTFYKFGDGDYYFLQKMPVGSATPGRRALSKSYESIGHEQFVEGAQLCDYYTCEIYPENIAHYKEVIQRDIDFPAEYGYGLVTNKWLLQTFAGKIGLIGANTKMNIIQNVMEAPQYQEYLGLEKFKVYISLPQKFACDDLDATEKMVGEQLAKSTSKIFLMGMGHVKSGLIHRLHNIILMKWFEVNTGMNILTSQIVN